MSVVGIIYGEQSGIIRRFVHADTPEELSGHTGPGETLLTVSAKQIDAEGKPNLARGIELVAAARGKPADDPRMAVVDKVTGVVAAVIMADPVLDAVTDCDLIPAYSPEIAAGVTYDKATGLFTAPITIAPATIDMAGKPVPQQIDGGLIATPAIATVG